MMERKFTDEEVIKSLECCVNNDSCKECPINPNYGNYGYCTNLALTHALTLINRQRAEIAELKQKYELAVAEREANVKALIDMTAEKYPWERKNDRYEDE
jgi:hypothetical protein